MKLVVDANIAFSLLKKDSSAREIFKIYKPELYSHSFVLDELNKYSEVLCSKLRISEDKFERIKQIFSKLVKLKKASPQQLSRARPLISDKKDVPYLALAIKLYCPVWSNDAHFKEQSLVKVFTTEGLIKLLLNNKL